MRTLLLMMITYSFVWAGGGVLEIVWPKQSQTQQKSKANYPKVLKEGIKEVRLPVYLSSQYIYDKSMVVVANEDFYSISFTLEGASVLFEGDRTYQEAVTPDNPEFQKIAQKLKAVEYSKSEEMMIAQYSRHGANYTISVECDNPQRDERCTQEKFIRKLYQSLVLVGGRP
ncbi:MAG TPA: hypothetical protein ENK82_04905 [Campylobacterales bacterium]|nr:hypothetical protein [Campylobacterales bacterium]HHS92664.1 hypothetical protein [Campylobacterales bacterium]